MGKLIDYLGQRFGLLLVQKRLPSIGRSVLWECLCDCGNVTAARAGNLRSGNTCSCGCQRDETTRRRSTTHGHAIGRASTPEHRAWKQALNRCRNDKLQYWKDYGGRGITVCPEWEASFQAFFDHIGPRPSSKHSLDRIDNDGNYEPGNVRWATRSQQARNTRPKRAIVVNGVAMKAREAAAMFGLSPKTVAHRLWRGYSDEEALRPSFQGRPARHLTRPQKV